MNVTQLRAMEAHKQDIVRRGEAAMVMAEHDDDCYARHGDGALCTCIPTLRLTNARGEKWVDVGRGWEREA